MKKHFLIPAALVGLALAGCGSDDSDELTGPATVIPADSPIYFEVAIRPSGEQAENLDAFLNEFSELPLVGSIGDPRDFAIEQLEGQAESAGVDFSYADDIEPWLGERAGVSVVPSDEEEVVVAVETTDEDQALESIQGLLEQGSTELDEDEYEGVTYFSDPSGEFSFGVFDGHVVFATQNAFEDAVDASEGDSLASSDKLGGAIENLGDDGLASLYLDISQFADLADSPEQAESFEQAQAVVPEIFDGAIAFEAGVSAGDELYIDYLTPLVEGQPEAGASALLESAPDDAIGAFAIEDVGAFVLPIVDLFERAQEEGADLEDFPEEGIAQAFEDEVGYSLEEAADSIGDLSLWVRGDLPSESDADGTLEVGGEIEAVVPEIAGDLIVRAEQKAKQEGDAKIGPDVHGAEVGFSALNTGDSLVEDPLDFAPQVDELENLPNSIPKPGESSEVSVSDSNDLPFFNIELDSDVIRYGFFRDQAAAEESDPEGAGDFAETETFAAGDEAVGDDFEYLGAIDLAPILDALVPSPGIDDAILGGSPEELIGPFLAGKLGVVAFGQRYDDGNAITRYALKLAE